MSSLNNQYLAGSLLIFATFVGFYVLNNRNKDAQKDGTQLSAADDKVQKFYEEMMRAITSIHSEYNVIIGPLLKNLETNDSWRYSDLFEEGHPSEHQLLIHFIAKVRDMIIKVTQGQGVFDGSRLMRGYKVQQELDPLEHILHDCTDFLERLANNKIERPEDYKPEPQQITVTNVFNQYQSVDARRQQVNFQTVQSSQTHIHNEHSPSDVTMLEAGGMVNRPVQEDGSPLLRLSAPTVPSHPASIPQFQASGGIQIVLNTKPAGAPANARFLSLQSAQGFNQGGAGGSIVAAPGQRPPEPNYSTNENFQAPAPPQQDGLATHVPMQEQNRLLKPSHYVKILNGLYGNAVSRFRNVDSSKRDSQKSAMEYWDKLARNLYNLDQSMARDGATDSTVPGARDARNKVSEFPKMIERNLGFDPRRGWTVATYARPGESPAVGDKRKMTDIDGPPGAKKARPSPTPSISSLPDFSPPPSDTGSDKEL